MWLLHLEKQDLEDIVLVTVEESMIQTLKTNMDNQEEQSQSLFKNWCRQESLKGGIKQALKIILRFNTENCKHTLNQLDTPLI